MILRKNKSSYYWREYCRLKGVYDELLNEGYSIDDKLNKCLWTLLDKYLDCILKETKF